MVVGAEIPEPRAANGHVRMLLHPFELLFQPLRERNVVAVHPRDILALRLFEADIQRLGKAEIWFVPIQPDPGIG